MSTTQNEVTIDKKEPLHDKSDNLFFHLENLYETKYADLSNGEKLGYREVGEGTTALVLHGNFTCSNVMEPIM